MQTLAQLTALASHALGGTPDARVDLTNLVNMACRRVVHAHSWSWRHVNTTVSGSIGSNVVTLPADFDSVAGKVHPTNAGVPVLVTTPGDILERQGRSMSDVSAIRVGFGVHSATGTPQMLIDPVPTVNGQPVLRMVYLRRWVNLPASPSSAVPNIPDQWEWALVLAIRGLAKQLEDDNPNELLLADAELARLKEEDSRNFMWVSNPNETPPVVTHEWKLA